MKINQGNNQQIHESINQEIKTPITQSSHLTSKPEKVLSQSTINQVNRTINRPANLSVNQSTNQSINQAINHSSQPSTNLSANQRINHKSLRNKSINQTNHQSLHQSTMPFINQTTIKTKRVDTSNLPGNLVMTTHYMILLTFPHPTPRNADLQVTKKKRYHSAFLWEERGRWEI